jgi:hypothetical protein
MRFLVLVAAAVGLLVPARAADVEFVRVWPGWRDAASFKRISEFFTDRENTGGQLIRRSHADLRAGYYFLTRVKHPGVSLVGARFLLRIITPGGPDPRMFTFPAESGPGEDVFELGLTGPDWPGQRTHPVAWKLELLGADGHPLASTQSFLWEKPEK